jgi:hypothetical protein
VLLIAKHKDSLSRRVILQCSLLGQGGTRPYQHAYGYGVESTTWCKVFFEVDWFAGRGVSLLTKRIGRRWGMADFELGNLRLKNGRHRLVRDRSISSGDMRLYDRLRVGVCIVGT